MVSLGALATKIFGSSNDRRLKSFNARVAPINALEPQFKALSDDELRGKTNEFRERLANGETVDDLLPEAFATVREAAWRTLGQRHFDMQLVGGMVLHSRQNFGNEDRRGQNPCRDAPILPECAIRPRRAHRHRERLSGQARLRMDGADPQVSWD